MTHHDFNEKLLLAKDTALDTLEDLCGQAFPRRKGILQTKPDGTPLTWEEKEAHRLAQPPRLDAEEQHVLVMERTQRMRAATTILKTRPIGEDGNPLPISRRHPERHTRTKPRPAQEQDAVRSGTECSEAGSHQATLQRSDILSVKERDVPPSPETSRANRETPPATDYPIPSHHEPLSIPPSPNPSSAHPGRNTPHTPQPAGEPAG